MDGAFQVKLQTGHQKAKRHHSRHGAERGPLLRKANKEDGKIQ
jgi:hypothetical protein